MWSLTHNSDIILYLEQGFLTALSQHAEGVVVVGVVQRDAVHAEETIARTQRSLSERTQRAESRVKIQRGEKKHETNHLRSQGFCISIYLLLHVLVCLKEQFTKIYFFGGDSVAVKKKTKKHTAYIHTARLA